MDVAKMVDVFQEKHGITLDPADPVLLLGTLAAELNGESLIPLGLIIAVTWSAVWGWISPPRPTGPLTGRSSSVTRSPSRR